MVNKNIGKKYNEDFKKMLLIFRLSNEYDVSVFTIYKWIKKHLSIETADRTTITADVYAKLQKQLLILIEL